MSTIGFGYGSQWHLLRYLGYRRRRLDEKVTRATGAGNVEWLDFRFSEQQQGLDVELEGIKFLPKEVYQKVVADWQRFWPQQGKAQNWDDVARIQYANESQEWLLVEAKAHVQELASPCRAKDKESGGLAKIRNALCETIKATDATKSVEDWLDGYYQYANRLAFLHFLMRHDVPARLLFVYFCGDSFPPPPRNCPRTREDWEDPVLCKMYQHLGLSGGSELEARTHSLFLSVCPDVVAAVPAP